MNHPLTLPFVICTALCAPAAFANPEDVVLDARLLPGWATDDGTQFAAVSLTLAPGWKTYWRSPGEAGIPPVFDWSGSRNLAQVRYHWPRPEVFHTSGMLSIGYHDGMLLPIEITAIDPSQPVVLVGRLDIGVCKDICVPAVLDIGVTLTRPGFGDPAIKAALRDQPAAATPAQQTALHCQVEPGPDGMRLTAALTLPAIGRDETVVVETTMQDVWVSDPVVMRSGSTLTAVVDLQAAGGDLLALDRSSVRLTVLGDGKAVEFTGCPPG